MIVTPTTDPFNMVIVAGPLYVLYELSILASARVERRRDRSGGAVLLALLALLPRRRRRLGEIALGHSA
jgi:Sec-independent protein secretion pathway component TatC